MPGIGERKLNNEAKVFLFSYVEKGFQTVYFNPSFRLLDYMESIIVY